MSMGRCHLSTLLTIRTLLDEVIESMRGDVAHQRRERPASETAVILGLTEEEQVRRWGT